MAHSAKQWEKAKYLFEIEKPLSEIEAETGISKGQISKKSKKEGWEKGNAKKELIVDEVHTIIKEDAIRKQKETISRRKKETLTKQETIMHDAEVHEIVDHQKKVETVSVNFQDILLARQKATKMLIEKIDEYFESELEKAKTPEEVQKLFDAYNTKLSMMVDYDEIKKGAEASDKIAVTLGVADRHAPKGDTNVNVQTNQVQAVTSGDAVTDAIRRKFNS